eukprot:Em0001g1579a
MSILKYLVKQSNPTQDSSTAISLPFSLSCRYYEVLDYVMNAITQRFGQDGFKILCKLEELLCDSNIRLENFNDILCLYGDDFDHQRLKTQLTVLHSNLDSDVKALSGGMKFKASYHTYSLYVWQNAFPTKSKKLCQQEVNEKWNAIKDSEEVIVKVDGLLNELKTITMKHKGGLLSFWGKQPTQRAVPAIKSIVPEMSVVEIVVAGDSDEAQKNGTFYGSAAHEKRQSDVYRSIKTLDELTKQLNDDGFNIHRGGVYLRLIPKRSSSLEEEIPSILGPNEACFIRQDDKARVPIGLTAANKQSPLLMHVEYRVSLPDHDWVVAAQHKLIPSVYAGIVVQPNGLGKPEAVSYSGLTYIAIRSGKHSSSTAYAHALDFERLLQLHEFDTITKYGPDNTVKPVLVISVDGGPDENPRYQKVIEMAVHHFVQNNLDAYFITTNAPGRSAFNRVERRMAPLSNELSGLILPHDKYGSHLNDQGLTIETDLEKKNFAFVGSTLAERLKFGPRQLLIAIQ